MFKAIIIIIIITGLGYGFYLLMFGQKKEDILKESSKDTINRQISEMETLVSKESDPAKQAELKKHIDNLKSLIK